MTKTTNRQHLFAKGGVEHCNNRLKAKLGSGFSRTLNIEHLLLTLALVNKSASVVGGRNNNAPPSASRNVIGKPTKHPNDSSRRYISPT
jgi:hypothetical protein